VNDDRLRELLSDAVSDIEPADRLRELRASVHPSPKVVPMARPRSWYAAAGIVATAAVIGVTAYLTSVVGERSDQLGPTGSGGSVVPTAIATDTAAPQPSRDHPRPHFTSVTVYFLGHGPRGDVLYPQPTVVSTDDDPLDAAVASLMTDPYEHRYRAGWSAGWLVSARLRPGAIDVELGDVPESRPAGMSRRTASEVVQSAVYTLQAAAHSQAKVTFLRSGERAPSVLGVPTDLPLAAGRATQVLSRMTITRPSVDGRHSRDGRLLIAGTSNGPQGTVVLRLLRSTASGERTVLTRTTTASGSGDPNRLYPWRVTVDTSTLRPGTYTVVASNADPAGRGHVATDRRLVLVR
jgi:hypothetical protein